MDSIVNTFSFELEHGGPHVHFLAFLLFIFIGIVILHGVFRIVIEVLSCVTKIPRDSWRNIFRFMPTLLGILNLPDFVQNILSYHYHSVVIITVTFFCAHTVSSFLKDKLFKSGDKAATTSILTTVVDLGVYMVNVSKFRKTNKRPSRICGGFFVYDLSGGFILLGLSLRRCR